MKKVKTVLLFVLLLLVFFAVRLHAQGDLDGCGDSPENPTLILGFIASAGSIGFVQARRWLRNRNSSKNK